MLDIKQKNFIDKCRNTAYSRKPYANWTFNTIITHALNDEAIDETVAH